MLWDSKIWAIARRLTRDVTAPLRSGYLSLGFFGVAFIVAIVLAAKTGLRSMWLCAVAEGVLVGYSLLQIKWKKHKSQQEYRRVHGLCLGCGYDLRETLGRCPECGTIALPICRACGRDMSDAPDECCECGTVPSHLLNRTAEMIPNGAMKRGPYRSSDPTDAPGV